MTELSCDAVADLLPMYALDALYDEERADVEAHLEGCDLHEEALAFERTAARLAEAVPEREPPAALRGRILTAASDLESELATNEPPRAPTPIEAARPAPIETTRPAPAPVVPMQRSRRWLPMALAAAIAVVVVAFVSLNALGNSDDGSVTRTASANGITTTLVYNAGDASATVDFEALPALDATQAYQLWTIAPDATPASAGLLVRLDDGTATQSLSGTFEAGTTFAITVEPAGGSDQPTTTPLVTTHL